MLILALGSNIYPRELYLKDAISLLISEGVISMDKLHISSAFKTKAIQKNTNNDYFDLNFLNIVIAYDNVDLLDCFEILAKIKLIETILGRVYRGIWAPREIDIDIICYKEDVINHPNLTVPHKELLNRVFVMAPLLELLPDFSIMKNNEKILLKSFIKEGDDDSIISKTSLNFKKL